MNTANLQSMFTNIRKHIKHLSATYQQPDISSALFKTLSGNNIQHNNFGIKEPSFEVLERMSHLKKLYANEYEFTEYMKRIYMNHTLFHEVKNTIEIYLTYLYTKLALLTKEETLSKPQQDELKNMYESKDISITRNIHKTITRFEEENSWTSEKLHKKPQNNIQTYDVQYAFSKPNLSIASSRFLKSVLEQFNEKPHTPKQDNNDISLGTIPHDQ